MPLPKFLVKVFFSVFNIISAGGHQNIYDPYDYCLMHFRLYKHKQYCIIKSKDIVEVQSMGDWKNT